MIYSNLQAAAVIASIILYFSIVGAVGYIIAHFVIKFW